MSEYGKHWEANRSEIERLRGQINCRPAEPIKTTTQLETEIIRLQGLQKLLAAAEREITNTTAQDR